MSALIILDLETSGLDPNRHEILELGMLAVAYGSLQVLGAYSTVLKVSSGFMGAMDPEVVQMHTNNGLLAEVRGERSLLTLEAGGWPYLREAEAQAIGFMNYHGGQRSPLGGFNPAFDRGFLKRHMPGLEANFHYRSLDANFIPILIELVTGERKPKEPGAHRALADCYAVLDCIKRFLAG